jgi:putative endonuclease
MNYLYVLRSEKKKWYYIGSTRDLKKRLENHNSGKTRSTKFYKPFELVYYEAYESYSLAKKRELELKTKGQQKEMLFERLGI